MKVTDNCMRRMRTEKDKRPKAGNQDGIGTKVVAVEVDMKIYRNKY